MTPLENPLYIPLQEVVVSRLLALRRTPDESLSHVVDRLIDGPLYTAHKKPIEPIKQSQAKPKYSKYQLLILGELFPVSTYREALATCLNTVADLDPGMLEKVAQMKGHTRRFIAKDSSEIHIGRTDLNNRCTYEFRPGWFVGTNYSLPDTKRILRGICEASGLEYEKDISIAFSKKC